MFVFPVFASECEHDFVWIQVPGNCQEGGYQGYQCSICYQTKDFEPTPQLEHNWSQWEILEEATCGKQGVQVRYCETCGKEQQEAIPRTQHSYWEWVVVPTCGRDGYTLHSCQICGHEEKSDRIERLGHDLQVLVVDPTCTKDGYTNYQCTRCTYSRKEDPVPKLGHTLDSGVVTKEPDLDSMGRIRYTCLKCGYTRTDPLEKWSNPFLDVAENAYYRDSVTWAYHTGITTGTDETHFSPEGICSRAQVVTFLWRWAGCPEPVAASHPFRDVAVGSYYEKAVAWAVSTGITNGVSTDRFGPDMPCTRAQVVTLLYRYVGSPEGVKKLPFTDVKEDDYFAPAVRWAYKEKITTGTTAELFSPDGSCTRGQIVTFLFRTDQ